LSLFSIKITTLGYMYHVCLIQPISARKATHMKLGTCSGSSQSELHLNYKIVSIEWSVCLWVATLWMQKCACSGISSVGPLLGLHSVHVCTDGLHVWRLQYFCVWWGPRAPMQDYGRLNVVSRCILPFWKKNYAGSENHSPHQLRKRSHFVTEYRKAPPRWKGKEKSMGT
jgi:hypothetical protein